MNVTAPLHTFVPEPFRHLADPARDLPRIAKDPAAMAKIGAAVAQVPTRHRLLLGDARHAILPAESVHLVLTSPPYWTLKEYRRATGQLGCIARRSPALSVPPPTRRSRRPYPHPFEESPSSGNVPGQLQSLDTLLAG